MDIYNSSGTFDAKDLEFSLNIQLTDIEPDAYEITAYYNICNADRYAILAILQTKDGNDKDLSSYPANYSYGISNIKFADLDQSYLGPGDKDIFEVTEEDVIDVIVHHGIGFDPLTNSEDDLYIKNYKTGTYIYYSKGSPPGARGTGVLQ